MIELKRNVVMFTILTVGAIYFLYEDLRKIFTPLLQTSNEESLESDELIEGHFGRKLLAIDSNLNEYSLELKTELNPFIKKKLNNDGKMKEISKSFFSFSKPGRKKVKKLSRRKRNARPNDFGWKINLNVTNNKNLPKEIIDDGLSSKSGKEKFLNMAVQMEGASPDDSFKELHQAWDSLGLLLRRLYGKNASFKENAHNVTAEISTESSDIESPDSLNEKPERGRKSKFLFGLLNFGSSENPPINGNGTILENGDSLESVTSQKANVVPMEGPTSTRAPLSKNATEEPIEAFGIVEPISIEPTLAPITETILGLGAANLEFNTQFAEKLAKTSASPVQITTIKPEPSFTSEQLKEFCISLLSRIQASPKSVDHFSDEDGSGDLDMVGMKDEETITGFQSLGTDVPKEVTTKSTNQRFGIWASIWNRFAGRRLVQPPVDVTLPPSMIPKNVVTSKATEVTEEAFNLKKESSTIMGISESTESHQDFASDEDGSALTVPDCESFFRQIQSDAVFSKPNLLDIINNPILLSLDPSQFNFTEIRDDQQMRSMRSGSEPVSSKSNFESDFLFTEEMMNGMSTPFSGIKSTVKELSDEFSENELSNEQLDNSFKNTILNQDALSTLNSFDTQESFQSGTFIKSNTVNLNTENGEDLRKSITETSFLSDKMTKMQIQSSTGTLDDGLFLQFDVRARTDESSETPSSEVSAKNDDRIFGLFNFGSGERNLEDMDSLTTHTISEFPENQSLHPNLINFSNGDAELNEAFSVNDKEITSTKSVTGFNVFDVILSHPKEESLMNSTESDTFGINEGNQPTEKESTTPSEKPRIELQFDSKERPTESQNALDPTNMLATHSISDDHSTLMNIIDERQQLELQFDPEEKLAESQKVRLGSTDMPVTKSLSKDQTPSQNVLDESSDEESRIFPALLNVIGSLMNSTESNTSDRNEGNQAIENKSTISTNMPVTKSLSEDQTPSQNVLDESSDEESRIFPALLNVIGSLMNSTESNTSDINEGNQAIENKSTISTNMPVTKSLSENQTPFQNVLDESSDEESRIFPALLNMFGSGDGREISEISTDQEINSEFECLDCLENKISSFTVDDFGSNTNDTILIGVKLSTTINPLLNKIVSDASVHDDAIYLNNKAAAFSESNQDPLEFSTLHSLKSLISSPVPETINYEYYDNSANTGYESTSYENFDNSKNIGYDVTSPEHYDNSEHIGYEMPNYEYPNSENNGFDITTLQPLEHEHIEGECDESHFDIETEAISISPIRAVTVPKDPRFMDTLFLTGSGAGGLFGNDDGAINLVQEPDTTSFPIPLPPVPPRQSRRGGRMDDALFTPGPTEEKESWRQSDFMQPQETLDNPEFISKDSNSDKKAFQKPEEEKRFSTDSISHLTTLGSIQTMEDGFNHSKINPDITRDVSREAVTAISNPTNSFVFPKKKAKDLPPRYCNHAGECNIVSNEGCITKEGRGVCDCRRSFVRHPETDICEAPFMMRTSLKLPAEVFHEDLRDKYSELYRNKTKDAIDTMWMVVYQDPTLEYNVADINVAGFEEGSLVIHFRLIFAVKNVSISEIVQEVDEKLEENFKRQTVLMSAPLNVENAKLLSLSRINPCEKKELNYCSKDADCIRDEYRGFRCRCKDGYQDNSKNPVYSGELCIALCPPDYCGENGYCEVRRNGEKQCLCNGWYFGEKCNVSGILVISCFAAANCVLISLVLATVFFCKRRRQRRTTFYENNQVMFQPSREVGPFGRVSPRLAASIALDELGPTKTSKYMAISTPLYMKPDIQITSPSIMGSSISYDYDSTFDRTPSAEVNMEPPKYDSVPEVPKYNSVPDV